MSRSSDQHRMEPFHQRTYHFCFSAHRSTLLLFKQTWKNVQRHPMGGKMITSLLNIHIEEWIENYSITHLPSPGIKNSAHVHSTLLYSSSSNNTINSSPTYLEQRKSGYHLSFHKLTNETFQIFKNGCE